MLTPEKDWTATAINPQFVPTHYMRLQKCTPKPTVGTIEYTFSDEGMEDPECTICPIMIANNTIWMGRCGAVYFLHDETIYFAEVLHWNCGSVLLAVTTGVSLSA